MLLLPDCKMSFVCGPVASGKTHLIKKWLEADNRHVIFDGTGEFLDDPGRETIWANPLSLNQRLKANPYYYRVVYQPGRNRAEDFSHVLNVLWWMNTPKLLVCDEFHEICPVDSLNEDVETMLRFARHDKLGFLGASQRIADVHKLFTAGCRMVVLFNTQEARDLEAIEARWRCARMVENLRPLLHDDATGETKQVLQCVVVEKGKRPYIYDFQTKSAAAVRTPAPESVPDETEINPAVPDADSNTPVSELPGNTQA